MIGTNRRHLRIELLLAATLVALTVTLYAPVRSLSFVNYDDNIYVSENDHIRRGLTADNALWSLTVFENANWHPLTLMSHMLDVDLFGLDPSGHHVVNLVLHVLNVVLLFWLLSGTTLRPWPSAFVSALFAVHPLNVQTVAWVSERKSLLSTAFWFAALLAHVGYRRKPRASRYALLVALAAMAMAAKPMAVTLPLTVLLLDLWPLGAPLSDPTARRRIARELAPLIALALVCGTLTLFAQNAGKAIQPIAAYSIPVRLGNAVVAYAWYLKSVAWPNGLAVYYPHPLNTLASAKVLGSAIGLAAICAIVFASRRSCPATAMGWWWYVGTLIPVAGLIQVGSQAYADRYAYVPVVGIFILVVWSAHHLVEAKPALWRRALATAGVIWIAALSMSTRAQLPHWRDSVALFQRAIEVVPDNGLAHNNLGMALVERNDLSAALEHFQKAVAINPTDTDARSNLGNALRALGRPAEAVEAYEAALALSPEDASIHFNVATALIDLRRITEATTHLNEAVRLDPSYAKARILLGTILYGAGRADAALDQFREVVKADPSNERAGEWVRRIESQLERRGEGP